MIEVCLSIKEVGITLGIKCLSVLISSSLFFVLSGHQALRSSASVLHAGHSLLDSIMWNRTAGQSLPDKNSQNRPSHQ